MDHPTCHRRALLAHFDAVGKPGNGDRLLELLGLVLAGPWFTMAVSRARGEAGEPPWHADRRSLARRQPRATFRFIKGLVL